MAEQKKTHSIRVMLERIVWCSCGWSKGVDGEMTKNNKNNAMLDYFNIHKKAAEL